MMGSGQAVRHGNLDPVFGGSNPPSPASIFNWMIDKIILFLLYYLLDCGSRSASPSGDLFHLWEYF